MELVELKQQWNDVLDLLERSNRIAWLVFFDARLVSIEGQTLILDFLDRNKLAAGHDLESHISTAQLEVLKQAIFEVTGETLNIAINK